MNIENFLFFSNGVSGKNSELSLEVLAQKAGFLFQESSGVWSLLTLGHRAQKLIEQRVEGTMESLGALSCQLSLLQDMAVWKKSRRDHTYGEEQMKVRLRDGKIMALSATAEESITNIVGKLFAQAGWEGWTYQMGSKWRDEIRARGGLVRAKEFRMMDAYSFSKTQEGIVKRHGAAIQAFLEMMTSMGLKAWAENADCGEIGGLNSTEIQVESQLGTEQGGRKVLELAHLFNLGDQYSRLFNAKTSQGWLQMGCQGIGTSRLLMALLEARRDERGFWGDDKFNCAEYYVMTLGGEAEETQRAVELTEKLKTMGKTYILDTRNIAAGKKFMDSELMMVQKRVVFSKMHREQDLVEITERKTMHTEKVGRETATY